MKTCLKLRTLQSSLRKLQEPFAAFTLVELLVVVVVLGMLLMTALARPPNRARQATCIANLRQVGAALDMYLNDNSGWLPPGPGLLEAGISPNGLTFGQQPVYGSTSVNGNFSKWLPYYIATELGLPTPSQVNGMIAVKVFICPAYDNSMPVNSFGGSYKTFDGNGSFFGKYDPSNDNYYNAFPYSLVRDTTFAGYTLPNSPFGKQGTANSMRLNQIAALAPLNAVWVTADFDTNCVPNPTGLTGAGVPPGCALKPVHGNVRNYLYFDGHTAPKQVAGYQNY